MVADPEREERRRVDPGQQANGQETADMETSAIILDAFEPFAVLGGGEAGDGGHHQVGEHPAGLAKLQERLAEDVIGGDFGLGVG